MLRLKPCAADCGISSAVDLGLKSSKPVVGPCSPGGRRSWREPLRPRAVAVGRTSARRIVVRRLNALRHMDRNHPGSRRPAWQAGQRTLKEYSRPQVDFRRDEGVARGPGGPPHLLTAFIDLLVRLSYFVPSSPDRALRRARPASCNSPHGRRTRRWCSGDPACRACGWSRAWSMSWDR